MERWFQSFVGFTWPSFSSPFTNSRFFSQPQPQPSSTSVRLLSSIHAARLSTMKRVWRISDASQRSELLSHLTSSSPQRSLKSPITLLNPYSQNPTALIPFESGFGSSQRLSDQALSSHSPNSALQYLISLFSDDKSCDAYSAGALKALTMKVSQLKDEILGCKDDSEGVLKLLDEKCVSLLVRYPDGSAFVELLEQLRSCPLLAIEVFGWRRKMADPRLPMTAEEYSKGIAIAGRAMNVNLARELFAEAANKRIKATSTYNALMGAYMCNGLSGKCESLFRSLKGEKYCSPTIVTYNMLISVFGRLLLVDQMEATLDEIKTLNLTPTLKTYNNLIAGYLTAWMWDRMERTYLVMKAGSVHPDTFTHLLMLRGYSHSGNLVKMEEMYELIKQSDMADDLSTIRTMICAYCKSSDPNKIRRIDELRKSIPENHYRPWLNVLLIGAYAREGLIDTMEELINEAFERQITVATRDVMLAIITAYFHCDAVDRLAKFVRRAEYAGWRLCRSLYHCKMVMYASQNRLMEMEGVLSEMESANIYTTKRTLIILKKAYQRWGPSFRISQIKALLWKRGYETPYDECSS